MPHLLLLGLIVVAPTLLLGGAMITHWARVHWEREAPARRRRETVELMLRAADHALDPEPSVGFNGLRLLGSLREAELLEPEDDDFIEEIAKVVVAIRLSEADDDARLVVGTTAGLPGVPYSEVVLPHELLAALVAIDIAVAKGRAPGDLVWRVANAASAEAGPQLRRTA